MDHLKKLGTQPVGQLLWNMSLPACAGLMSIMLYNVVDTIFVGRFAGSLAIAGVSIVIPVLSLLPTFGMAIGVGAGSVISRALGAQDHPQAHKAFGNAVSSAAVICVVLTVLGCLFTEQVLAAFGARGDMLPYARSYFRIAMLGIPFVGVWMCLNNILRAEGHSRQAMTGMWFGAILNVALDTLFIVVLGMGLEGAALATVISQALALMYSLHFYTRGKSIFHLSLNTMGWETKLLKEIYSLGASSLARQGAGSIMVVALNYNLYLYGGSMAVAVYGVLNRIFSLMMVPTMGTTQGFLPVAGYNFGAEQYGRVKESLLTAIKTTSILNVFIGGTVFLFPEAAIGVFTHDPLVMEYGTLGIRTLTLFMWLVPVQQIGSGYFQAVGKPFHALCLSMSRQIVLLIPLIFILGYFYQVPGIWVAYPMSDILSSLLVLGFLRKEWRKLSENEKQPVVEVYQQAA